MPVARAGFRLEPAGFFDRNPALDVPPSDPTCCSSKGHDAEGGEAGCGCAH